MLRTTLGLLVSGWVVAFSSAFAADADKPAVAAETLMCERGKLLLSDDFQKTFASPWKIAKGKWEVVGGAIQGSELKADMHGAVVRTNIAARNVVIQYSFKLEGAKSTTLSINDAQGHNSRVLITKTGITARKDDHDHAGPDKAEVLQAVQIPVAEGEWHTLVVEINGPEFLARLDGKQIAYGSHAAINVDKTNLGLTVAGESTSFKNFRVWEATPKADWATTKAKLIPAAAEKGK